MDEPARPEPPAGRSTILVVEDERSILRLTTAILEREGYAVLPARDGERAHAAVREADEPIDLVIADLTLPGDSGLEVVETLRERWPDLPALVISGSPDRKKSVPDGTGFLAKPFGPADLVEAVRRSLGEGGPGSA